MSGIYLTHHSTPEPACCCGETQSTWHTQIGRDQNQRRRSVVLRGEKNGQRSAHRKPDDTHAVTSVSHREQRSLRGIDPLIRTGSSEGVHRTSVPREKRSKHAIARVVESSR